MRARRAAFGARRGRGYDRPNGAIRKTRWVKLTEYALPSRARERSQTLSEKIHFSKIADRLARP
jgi:hypothetical protein